MNKHYDTFFKLSPKAKESLAASLGLPTESLKSYMYRKRQKEKERAKIVQQFRTSYEDDGSINTTGMYKYIYT